MLFLNPWLLAGLAAASIPVIIHLVRQQAAKPIEWGAMRFLFDTISVRRRRMQWEDLLLMAARCLLLGLLALALARPFIPPDSTIPWLFVLPAGMLAVALLGGSFVLTGARARWFVRIAGGTLLAIAAGLILMEKFLNLKRFQASGGRDVALVIDASASMEINRSGKTAFQQAIEEARQVVKDAPGGTAFSVILGGPAPEAKTAAPLTHRADVLGVLDKLEPVGGTFRAHEALGMATLGLSQGTNGSKEIIVFTDSQRPGWRFDSPAAWDTLANAWQSLSAKPKLVLRDFGTPSPFRNVALSAIEMSRGLIGTDRELAIRVTVENTGSEAITPGPLVLEADGVKSGERSIGLLMPGQSETVEFPHRFLHGGPQVAVARIEAGDDLPGDNHLEKAISVRETLPVLLVDGNPAGSFFDRAAGYSALALAPSAGVIGGKKATEKFLMDPRVVPAGNLSKEDIDGAAVIVLADVPRLPEAIAARLATKVADGAGLVVIAGPRAEPDFFNGWKGPEGPLLPLELSGESVDSDGISPAQGTFTHESLKIFSKGNDLAGANLKRWRQTGPAASGGVVAAAFSNGDPFLAVRAHGNGRVVMATCAFDARSGNLPAKRSFVPLVHELVTWAAGGGVDLNTGSAWNPSFMLASGGGGLSANYYGSRDFKGDAKIRRVDPALNFDWQNESPGKGLPNDNFSVTWRGHLSAPVSGKYLFEAEVDDSIGVKLGNGARMRTERGKAMLGEVELIAGKPVPVQIDYQEEGGEASVKLFWTPPGGTRRIIPSMAFQPEKAEAEILKAVDPRGKERQASITSGRRGRELSIDGPALPGVYQVSTAGKLEDVIPGIARETLPVVVAREAAESRFESMTDEDLAFVRKRVDLVQPESVADILGVLTGKGFGREIWRMLAIAGFVVFLLESFLARWVSRSRRMAEDARVEFGESTVWRGGR